MTIGQRIEEIAEEKGLPSGKALADLFGVTYEALRSWRKGTSAPTRNRAAKVAEVLGVKAAAFMFPSGTSHENPFSAEVADRLHALHGRNPALFRRAYLALSSELGRIEAEMASSVAKQQPPAPVPETITGPPVPFVERRAMPAPQPAHVAYKRGVKVISTPDTDHPPIAGQLLANGRRHGDKPASTNAAHQGTAPKKAG